MSVKFHVNSNGEPGKCTAQLKNCPFGDENHYASKAAARAAFEEGQASVSAVITKQSKAVPFFEEWPEKDGYSYETAVTTAQKLKDDGKFVVIVASYIGKDWSVADPPEYEDFDEEWEYNEAYQAWESERAHVTSLDEFKYFYASGEREFQAYGYDSREDFEDEIKINGIPKNGAPDADNDLDKEESNSQVYRSYASNSPNDLTHAWYYEATVY